jgi:hypothetical protein
LDEIIPNQPIRAGDPDQIVQRFHNRFCQ